MTEGEQTELRRWLTAIARRVIEAHIGNRGTVETRQYAEDPHRTPAEWRSSVAHLDALSPRQRQVWELRVREDMSYAEIAVKMNLRIGTVHSRLARARAGILAQRTLVRTEVGAGQAPTADPDRVPPRPANPTLARN